MNKKTKIIVVVLMFCLLSFNKQNIKGSLLIVDNLIIKKTPKNMFLSGLNYQTDIYTILVNRFYLDTNLSNEYKALNVKEIRVVDVLGEVINGVFKGQWMRVLDEGGNTLYIPSFFLLNSLNIDTFIMDSIVNKNIDKILYFENSEDYFFNKQKIVFKGFDSIGQIYYLLKRICEQVNNKFPYKIHKKGSVNNFLNIYYERNEEGLSSLELKWMFDGGDLLISFMKIDLNIVVNIEEDFD